MNNFFNSDYMPHGHCFAWEPSILWLTVISDLAITAAYFSIPIVLVILVKKRSDLNFQGIFWLFAGFIGLCGITHAFAVFNLWHGFYGVHAVLKAMTAIVSIITSMVLFHKLDTLLAIPSIDELMKAENARAKSEKQQLILENETQNESIFRFITDVLPTGLLVFNEAQQILVSNEIAADIFGYKVDELKGKSLESLLPEGIKQAHDQWIEDFKKGDTEKRNMAGDRIIKARHRDGYEVSLKIYISSFTYGERTHLFAGIEEAHSVMSRKQASMEWVNRIFRAIKAGGDGVWEWNPQTNKVWYSDALVELLGRDLKEEPKLEHWMGHIHPEDQPEVEKSLNLHLSGQGDYDVCYRGMTTSGNYEWVRARGEAVFDAKGQPVLMSGTLSNIQEAKDLEKVLETNRHFLDKILEKSLCGFYIFDLTLNKNIYVNPEYSRITGYTLDTLNEVQADNIMVCFHPDEIAMIEKHIGDVVGSKESSSNDVGHEIEYRFKHKDGHWVWCYSRDVVFSRDENGDPLQMLGAFFDVSELKSQRDKTEILAFEFTQTFEQAAVGIARVGLNGCFERVNQKLCQIVGYSGEELQQLTFQEITHPDDLDIDLAYVKQLVDGESDYYQLEKRYFTKDEQLIWVKLTASIVRIDKEPHYFIAVIEDITAKKHTEIALEQSNQSLERFAYSASHDLQEPLRKISAFSSSLYDRLHKTNLDDDSQFELGRLNDAAKRMSRMIKSLLQLSRFNQTNIKKTFVDINDLLEEIKQDISMKLEASGATITVKNKASLYIDAIAFEQVIANLISNAIHYCPKERLPDITISTKKNTALNIQKVYIQDNGTGIDESQFEAVFEPFKRLVGRDHEGSGMGLSICRQIIQAHEGRIYVNASSEAGTCFVIELPLPDSALSGSFDDEKEEVNGASDE